MGLRYEAEVGVEVLQSEGAVIICVVEGVVRHHLLEGPNECERAEAAKNSMKHEVKNHSLLFT